MAAARHDLHALVSVDEGGHIYSAPTVERVKEEPEALRGARTAEGTRYRICMASGVMEYWKESSRLRPAWSPTVPWMGMGSSTSVASLLQRMGYG